MKRILGIFVLAVLPTFALGQAKTPVPKAEPPSSALVKLVTYPEAIELTGPRDEQRLGVVGEFADGRTWELTRTAT